MEEVVTPQALELALSKYERDQYTYKKLYYLLKDIAQICCIEFPQVGVPITKKSAMDPTDVPTDDEIIDWVMTAPEPYKWYFGMMATYGLRPHECDEARLIQNDDGRLVQVGDQTKTGYRTVIPQQVDWVELFDLRHKTERPESERNSDRNDACSQWLNKMRIKWASNGGLTHCATHTPVACGATAAASWRFSQPQQSWATAKRTH